MSWHACFGTVAEAGGATAPAPSAGEPLTVSAVAPNPTASRAVVALAVAAPTDVRAVVYDMLGRQVVVALDGPVSAAAEVAVDVAGLSAGTYVLRLTGAGAAVSRTFTVAR